ncbi:MAG: hypothetical protein ABW252_22655 [Polyangiales bacterium]
MHGRSSPRTSWSEVARHALSARGAALLGVALALVLASRPAWTGGPIYDDWLMRESDAMRSLADVLHAFGRTSADYFREVDQNVVGGVTYRPLAHASLILVQALGGGWLGHHGVSLGLHLGALVALFATLARRGLAWGAVALAALWALHPMHVEAYGWVNGRADVLAGALLAALAYALARASLPLAMLAAMGAVLAKETALFAALSLGLAALLPRVGLPERAQVRQRRALALAPLVGVGLAIALRAACVGLGNVGATALRAEPDMLPKLGRLLGEAALHVLVPIPRAMACLAYQLAQPLALPLVALLVVGAVGLGVLAWRRRFRALVLLGGALVTLAPTVVVSSAFWCGFDRYLYMPTLLCVLALPDLCGSAVRVPRVLAAVCLSGTLACLALATYATSTYYRGQTAFMTSLLTLRPDDPSGPLFGALFLSAGGRRQEALQLLAHVPRRGLPRPLASALVTRLAALGERDDALAVLDDMLARYPNDPYAILDRVWTSIQRGDLSSAFAAAERLRTEPGFCEGVVRLLAQGGRRREVDAGALARFRATYTCL